jgi:indole-3-glycerol phosphate synthase
MTPILERILTDKRARLESGEYSSPSVALAAPATDGARFLASLREPGVRVIAEIKHRSPSAGEILQGADGKIESFALAYRRGHAAAISVVTEEDHFGGKPEWLPRAKRISGLPVLMKDFVISQGQLDFAVSLGADAVLLIVRALTPGQLVELSNRARERGLATVVEVHEAGEIEAAMTARPDVLGVNARDLSTFATDLDAVERIAASIPPGPVRLAESGITNREDVARLRAAGYEAFLVGEVLLRDEDPEQALRDLKG